MEPKPIEIRDEYLMTSHHMKLTNREHGIPGLRMIGYHNTSHAKAPLPPHYHGSCFEFTYIVQGNLQFSAGNRCYPLSGGDLFITFPDEVHSTGDAPMSLHQMYWFQLEADRPDHLLYMDPVMGRWLLDRLRQLPRRVIRMDPMTETIFRRMFENLTGGTEVGRIQTGCLLSALLCQIVRDAEAPETAVTADIARTTRYISEHMGEELRMETLAKVSMLSVSRFKQKFKDQIGISPRNYINFRKIELAKQMLLDGSGVTETAMNLGFSGSDYFSVVFRRYTSVSPTEFVRQQWKA